MDFDLEPAPVPTATPPTATLGHSPIADLSYRNYDGPLKSRFARWWVIALAMVRQTMKSPAYWILFAFCLLRYIVACAFIYLNQSLRENITDPSVQDLLRTKYVTYFFAALCGNMNSFCLLCIALAVGAGSIAADNRSNALAFYLAKPVTKGDYLLGKWMGVFLSIYFATLVPALVLYLFCLGGYSSEGFLKEDPYLILRLLLATAVPGAFHASLLVGISAWSKTPRTAGATYAAINVMSYVVAGMILFLIFHDLAPDKLTLITHSSISGVIDGLVQNIYHIPTLEIPWFNNVGARGGGGRDVVATPPALWFILTLGISLVLAGIAAARARIRAVEVVRG